MQDYPAIANTAWRPLTRDDAPAIHALLGMLGRENGMTGVESAEDYATYFDNPATDTSRDSLGLFTDTGELVAMGWISGDADTIDSHRLDLWIDVHPDYAKLGLANFLLGWLENRGKQRCEDLSQDKPCWINVPTEWALSDRRQRYKAAGYYPRHSEQWMRRDLAQGVPQVTLPAEISLVAWTPENDDLMRQTFNATFADRTSSVYVEEVSWRKYYTGMSSFAADCSFIAMDGDESVGLMRAVIAAGDDEGEIGHVAVRPEWRRRGIARALMLSAMQGFLAKGLAATRLTVDVHNKPAIATYERLGFVVGGGYTSFSKDLRL